MTDCEFTDMAKDLRLRAIRVVMGYRLGADEVEDIAQDAMLKLWTVRGELHDAGHARGLLVTMVRHLCIDRQREVKVVPVSSIIGGRKAVGDISEMMKDDVCQPVDVSMEEAENERWLRQKLKQLPTSEYQVLHLRQVERKTNMEIADILGIEVTSVATLLSRARKKMLEEIRKRNS